MATDLENIQFIPYLMNRLTSSFNNAWLEQLRPHGLNIARWQALCVLSIQDGARVGEIAELCGTEQPVTSRVIDQLQRAGLVERRPAEEDQRVVRVWTTERGQALFEIIIPRAGDFVSWALRNFDDEDGRRLTGLLERLLADVSQLQP